MSKILSTLLTLIFVSTPLFAKSAKSFFAVVREQNLKQLPSSFSARISGKTIRQKLAAIPKSAYLDTKKAAWVRLDYTKSNSISILVANTDDLYRDLFAQYVRFFTLGPVLSDTPIESIYQQYEISYKIQGKTAVMLKLGIKGAQNHFLFYVNQKNKRVQRVDYYMGDKIMSSTIIGYVAKSFKGKVYVLPSRFFVKMFGGKDHHPEIFKLDRFEIR